MKKSLFALALVGAVLAPPALAAKQKVCIFDILGTSGDEAIHGILDMMHADQAWTTLQWAVPIHPTVSELIPTVLGSMKPVTQEREEQGPKQPTD